MVEREAGPVAGFAGDEDRVKVAGGDAGLKDRRFMGLWDAVAVVDDGQGSVAAVPQDRGDVDAEGSSISSVAKELEEGVLDAG